MAGLFAHHTVQTDSPAADTCEVEDREGSSRGPHLSSTLPTDSLTAAAES